jgi:hypothetical protein
MKIATKRRLEESFNNIGPKNPLRTLGPQDKKHLWACLKLYSETQLSELSGALAQFETASRTTSEAAKLAARIEEQFLGGPASRSFEPFMRGFHDLPAQLRRFSATLGDLLQASGRQGHKERLFSNRFLVTASELVRVRTGTHNDEHLAELFQSVGGENFEIDVSGDAIRKKREHIRKNYPDIYAGIERFVGNIRKPRPHKHKH